jgi:hypothetical protein
MVITFSLPFCFLTHSGFVYVTARGPSLSGTLLQPEPFGSGCPNEAPAVTATCNLASR